jgi:hypothetical protein
MPGVISYAQRIICGKGEYPSIVRAAVEGTEMRGLVDDRLAVVNYADGVKVVGVNGGRA